jgi:hypothetical protein
MACTEKAYKPVGPTDFPKQERLARDAVFYLYLGKRSNCTLPNFSFRTLRIISPYAFSLQVLAVQPRLYPTDFTPGAGQEKVVKMACEQAGVRHDCKCLVPMLRARWCGNRRQVSAEP